MPKGLTINSSSGEISGTPTTDGIFNVTVTVSDTAGGSVEDEFEIEVLPDNVIKGTSTSNSLYGTGMKDMILGYDGNDVLYGHGGDDTLFGHAGIDRI